MPKRKTYRKKRSYKKRSYKKRSYKKRSYKKRSYLRGGADEHLLTQPAGAWKGDEEQLSEALDTLEDFPAAAMDSPLPADGGEMDFGELGFGGFGDFSDESGGGAELDLGQSEFDFLGGEDLGMLLPPLDEGAGHVPGATLNAVTNFGQLGSQPMAGSLSLGDEGGARADAAPDELWDYTTAVDDEPVCFFAGKVEGTHRGKVQKKPFTYGRFEKWVEMKEPRKPMCTGCTATMRKHYNGTTNSPELVAEFVKEVGRYKCPGCKMWKDGADAAAAEPPNFICTECDWRGGNRAPNKPRGRSVARREAAEPEHVPDELGAGRLDIEEFDPAGGTFDQPGVTAFMGDPMDLSLGDQTLQPLPAQAMQPPEPAAKARSRPRSRPRATKRSKEQEEDSPTRWRCRTDPGYTRTVIESVDCYILRDELSPKLKEYNVRWSTLINIFNLLKKEPCCTDVETLSSGMIFASKMQCRARVAKLNSIFETMADDQMDKFNELLIVNAHFGDGVVCRGRSRVDPSEIQCGHGTIGCHGGRVETRRDGRGGTRSRVGLHKIGCEGHVPPPREDKCSNFKTPGCRYNPKYNVTRHTDPECPGYLKQKERKEERKRAKLAAAPTATQQPVAPAPPPVQAFAAAPSPPGIQLAAMDPMAGGPPPPAYQVQPPAAQAVTAFAVPHPPAENSSGL
jgi:hypothetical protein